jgi:hypothetical protein
MKEIFISEYAKRMLNKTLIKWICIRFEPAIPCDRFIHISEDMEKNCQAWRLK